MSIVSFKHKGLAEVLAQGESRKVGSRYVKNVAAILDYLDQVTSIEDCKDVKDFHELKGKRKGTYSMHVTGNYCITFKWDGHDMYDVNFEDYH